MCIYRCELDGGRSTDDILDILVAKTQLGDIIAVENYTIKDTAVKIANLTKDECNPVSPQYTYPLMNICNHCDIVVISSEGVQVSRELGNDIDIKCYNYEKQPSKSTSIDIYPLLNFSALCAIKAKDTIGDAMYAAINEDIDSEALGGFALLCKNLGIIDTLKRKDINVTVFVPTTKSIESASKGRDLGHVAEALILHHMANGYVSVDKSSTVTNLNGDNIYINCEKGRVNKSDLMDIDMHFSNGTIHILSSPIAHIDTYYEDESSKDPKYDYVDSYRSTDDKLDMLDISSLCNIIREQALRIYEDELINMETNINNILKPSISSSISIASNLISDSTVYIDDSISSLIKSINKYKPPSSKIWGSDDGINYDSDDNTFDMRKDLNKYNGKLGEVLSLLSNMSALRTKFESLCCEIRNTNAEIVIAMRHSGL